MKQFLRIPVLLLMMLCFQRLASQTITVSVTVVPPYSTQPKDYIQQGNNVTITIINGFSVTQNVKVIPSLTGINNSVSIKLREDYTPTGMILLAPGQSKVITLNQLKAYNASITSNDILTQGMTKEDYFNGKPLPEGMYKVCMKVISDRGPAGGGGGSFEGCGAINIQAFEAPIILNPVDKSSVKPLNPQFVNFGWTATGQVGKTKYTLKIVDLTATNVFNPNDAFNGNVLPFFQQNNIAVNSFQMDNSKPKLIENHKYAIEVTAYDPNHQMNFKNQGRSKVTVFDYKNQQMFVAIPVPPNAGDPNEVPPGPCNGTTKWNGTLKNDHKDGLPNGTALSIGYFLIKNTVFTKTSGGYDGSGEILINFLKTKVKVEFTGIKVNSDNRVREGKVTAKVTSNTIINDNMAKTKDGEIETVPNMPQLMSKLDNAQRQVKNLKPQNPAVDLPIALPKDDFNMGIVGIIFEPTEAYANMVFNAPVPQLPANEYVLLSAKGVKIHPNGYGAEVKIGLPKTKTVNVATGKMYMVVEEGSSKTYATLDCNGIKEVKLTGKVEIDRSLLLPVNVLNQVIADEKVSVPFTFTAQNNFDDFVIEDLNLSSFVIPGFNDFVIKPSKVGIDFSAVKNIGNFKPGDKSWNGIYIKTAKLQLPDAFKTESDDAATLEFSDSYYISKQGFNGSFAVEKDPIIKGTLAGFGYSLTKLELDVNNSTVSGGALKGKLKLPLGEDATVGFEGTIAKGNKGANMSLSVSSLSAINATCFFAKIKLDKNSSIKFTKGEDDKLKVSTLLNGNIGIDFKNKPANSTVSSFELPTLDFQGLSIKQNNGTPDVDFEAIGLQSKNKVQAKLGSFELNLNNVEFKKNDNKIGLKLDLGLTLFGGENKNSNGAGGGTAFTIWANYANKTFTYNKTTLDKIKVDADLGAAKIKGEIEIFNQDETYGNGFRGNVKATMRGLGAEVGVTVQFGKTLGNSGFKYWYFDAMANFGNSGIPIPGTVAALYGFGGGAWCNMVPKVKNPPALYPNQYVANNKGGDAAPTQSGAEYTPKKGTFGFFASVMFGLAGTKTAFNGDLRFSMTMKENLSIENVNLHGNAFIMQNPENLSVRQNPDKAMVHCEADINYDGATNCISGYFDASVNVANILKGGGKLSFKFDMPDKDEHGNVINKNEKTKWFIKVGSWTEGADPFDDMARIHAKIGFDAKVAHAEILFQTYLMVGNDLPKTLPPMPDYIYQLVKDEGMSEKTKPQSPAVADEQNLAFAFGAGIKLTAGFDFFVVKADLEAAAGFDVLLANVNGTCDGSPMGVNGWYAQGQAYAYLKGDIKLFRRITLAEFIAGAVMQVKLPNPNWIRGDVVAYIDVLGIDAGEYHGTFEKGTRCSNMKVDDFDPFKGIKLIKNVAPENKAKKVDPYGNLAVDFAYSYGQSGTGTTIHMYDAFNNKEINYIFQGHYTLKDNKGHEVKTYAEWSDKNPRHISIRPKEILLDSTEYTLDVYAYAKNSYYQGKTEGVEDHVTVKFTTAGYPNEILMKDIGDAYPLPGQRYVMKKDTDGKKALGKLDIKRDMTYFVTKYQKDYKLIIRFKEVGTDNTIDVQYKSFDNDPKKVTFENSLVFNLPEALKKSTIYQMSVVLKPRIPGSSLKERIIFEGYHFKMSAYESLKEKFADLKVKKTGYLEFETYIANGNFGMVNDWEEMRSKYNIAVLLTECKEGFDIYEYDGYKNTAHQTKYTGGKLWQGSESAMWLRDYNGYYLELETVRLSQSEKNYLKSIADLTMSGTWKHDWFYVDYGPETPWSGHNGYPFASVSTVYFLKNSDWYINTLRKSGTLEPNENIAKPEGLLTKDEIQEAESKGNGSGLQFGNNKKASGNNKVYWAIADYTPWKAAIDMDAMQSKFLEKSNTYDKLVKTWKILKKLPMPDYPKGQHTLNMYMSNYESGNSNGIGQSPFFKLTYNYKP